MPVVLPSNTPLRISGRSDSLRGDEISLCAGRRRASSGSRSASESDSPAGTPSTTTPSAAPCDSPNVAMRRISPKLLLAIAGGPQRTLAGPSRGGDFALRAQPLRDGSRVGQALLRAAAASERDGLQAFARDDVLEVAGA